MLFSIIIPAYNVEKYILQCLTSIEQQTFQDYEAIIVNDGSTDRTGELIDQFATDHNKFRVIHQKNSGSAIARNTGTENAIGNYIVYIDSDDYYSTNLFLDKLSYKCDGNTDIIWYGYKKYYEDSGRFGRDVSGFAQMSGKTSEKVILELLNADLYDGCAWGKAVKNSLLRQNHIEFVPGMISEDSDWFLQVASKAKIHDCINEAFVVYRQRENSISHAPKMKSLTDNIYLLETWPERFDKIGMSRELKKVFMAVLARYYSNLLILYTLFPDELTKEYNGSVKRLSYLLKYSVTRRSKIIRIVYGIFGMNTTVTLLKLYKKIRS